MNKMNLYVINPDNGKQTPADEWLKEANPERAELVAIDQGQGTLLVFSKNHLPELCIPEKAKPSANRYHPAVPGFEKVRFRNPTRKDCIDIYDAIVGGLDQILEILDGNRAKSYLPNWTSDIKRRDEPWYWSFYIQFGTLDFLGEKSRGRVIPVTVLVLASVDDNPKVNP